MFPELITELLQDGYKVNFSAPGHSMFPTILANETIMVEPIDPLKVMMGDIILYRTNGRLIAHRVIDIKMPPDDGPSPRLDLDPQPSVLSSHHFFILQGDAVSACDAPVKSEQILGKVVSIERNGCSIDPYSFMHNLRCLVLSKVIRIKRMLRMISSVFFRYDR